MVMEEVKVVEILTIGETMVLLKVSRWTIYRWVKRGYLERLVLPSGGVRIFKESVYRVLRDGSGSNS